MLGITQPTPVPVRSCTGASCSSCGAGPSAQVTNSHRVYARAPAFGVRASDKTGGHQNCRARQLRRRLHLLVRAEAEPSEGQVSTLEKSGNAFKALKDIEEIQKLLPHRFPFLLLDRVVEFQAQKYAVGYKNITANDNFFTGHFPDRKIMPGVLQVEAMAQLGGIVMMDPDNAAAQQNFFFGGIEACKFRRPVVPGDTLMMKVELTKYNKRFGIAKMTAKAYVGPDLACEADLTLVMAK